MIAAEDCVLVLLAAGRSQRMGDLGSKLDEPFLGRALGLHVAGDWPQLKLELWCVKRTSR